jgi:hypothetical protein
MLRPALLWLLIDALDCCYVRLATSNINCLPTVAISAVFASHQQIGMAACSCYRCAAVWRCDVSTVRFCTWFEYNVTCGVTLQAVTAVVMRIPFFWDVTLCRLACSYRHFKGLQLLETSGTYKLKNSKSFCRKTEFCDGTFWRVYWQLVERNIWPALDYKHYFTNCTNCTNWTDKST